MFEHFKSVLKNFSGYDDEQMELICSLAENKIFKKNDYLLTPGKICRHIYFVNSGCLRFFGVNEEGVENTRYLGFRSKFATNLTSFIQFIPSEEYIQSVVETEVIVIGRTDFYRVEKNTLLGKSIYKNILERAYITTQKRIYSFQGEMAEERLTGLILKEPEILSSIPHKIIASYLGITPYTFSRLVKNKFS